VTTAVIVPVLSPGQAAVLQQALADAIYYRDPPLHCPDCDALPGIPSGHGMLCQPCQATLDRARAYLDLSRQLGLTPPLPPPPLAPAAEAA
jgi:hypothetical protein